MGKQCGNPYPSKGAPASTGCNQDRNHKGLHGNGYSEWTTKNSADAQRGKGR